MYVGGLSFRVCLHLASNPGAELTCKDIARRFHAASAKVVRNSMATAMRAGYVVNATGKPGRGRLVRYVAGPRLLAEVGRE